MGTLQTQAICVNANPAYLVIVQSVSVKAHMLVWEMSATSMAMKYHSVKRQNSLLAGQQKN